VLTRIGRVELDLGFFLGLPKDPVGAPYRLRCANPLQLPRAGPAERETTGARHRLEIDGGSKLKPKPVPLDLRPL